MLSIEINAFVSDTSNQMIISTSENFNSNECKFFHQKCLSVAPIECFCRLIAAPFGSCSGENGEENVRSGMK